MCGKARAARTSVVSGEALICRKKRCRAPAITPQHQDVASLRLAAEQAQCTKQVGQQLFRRGRRRCCRTIGRHATGSVDVELEYSRAIGEQLGRQAAPPWLWPCLLGDNDRRGMTAAPPLRERQEPWHQVARDRIRLEQSGTDPDRFDALDAISYEFFASSQPWLGTGRPAAQCSGYARAWGIRV
jgi:hypothetical protein